MFSDIREFADDCAYMKAMSEHYTPNVNLLKLLPSYKDLKHFESQLRSNGLINFNTVFHEPTGYYLMTCFLRADFAMAKAVFLKDIEIYRTMRDLNARYQVALLIYERFIAPENEYNTQFVLISVFDRKAAAKILNDNKSNKKKKSNDIQIENKAFEQRLSLELCGGVQTNAIGVFANEINEVKKILDEKKAPSDLFNIIFDLVLNDLRLDVFPRFCNSEFYEMYIRTKWYEAQEVDVKDFSQYRPLGRGAFGLVTACKKINCNKMYACKCMSKQRLRHHISQVMNERNVSAMIDSKFVVCLKYCVQDKEKVYFILDLMNGGDLRFHLNNEGRFSEVKTRFYAAEVLLGLEALHRLNIIYRDMKPENILLDSDGHVKISDLGLAVCSVEKIKGYAGTPGYCAPEVCKRLPYGKATDLFSFGVMIYRLLSGRKPFPGKKPADLDKKCIEHTPQFNLNDFSPEAIDILKGLLEKDPDRRMTISQAKEHPWFKSIDWGMLEAGYIDPPFYPPNEINAESLSIIGKFDDEKKITLSDDFQKKFDKFNYISLLALQREIVEVLEEFYKNRTFEDYAIKNTQLPPLAKPNNCCSIS